MISPLLSACRITKSKPSPSATFAFVKSVNFCSEAEHERFSMFVAVYFKSKTGMARDELGDLILDAFMDKGEDHAKVTGGGSGLGGSNIDLKVDDSLSVDEVLRRIRQALQSLKNVGRHTEIQIEGQVFPLYPAST
jgi:hypothetical protein